MACWIHLNALLNLLEHPKKLNRWLEKESQIGQLNAIQVKLHPFLFNYTIIHEKHIFLNYIEASCKHLYLFSPFSGNFYFEYRFADFTRSSPELAGILKCSWQTSFWCFFSILLFYFQINRKSRFSKRLIAVFHLPNGNTECIKVRICKGS